MLFLSKETTLKNIASLIEHRVHLIGKLSYQYYMSYECGTR